MIRNLFGGSKCRTVDVCDIFGDNSGKALFRLDGNANDESGNYHGTETAITYGGGVYERGAVFNGSTSKLDATSLPSMGTSNAVSFYINTATTANQGFIEYSNGTNLIAIYHTSTTLAVRVNALLYTVTTTLPKSAFNHIAVSFTTDVPTMYLNNSLVTLSAVGATAIAGTSGLRIGIANVATVQTYTNGVLDQVRIFNRAITATEVATLYAECVPTSTVDNINPFEDGSLKALYQFNGDVTDKTGVYNGTATNVTYGTGKFGQCAVFNGTALVSTTFALSANVFSYSGWFKVTTPSSTTQSLIDFTTNRAMLSSGNGTNAYISYYDGGTSRTFSTYTLPTNTFVFLSLVINGTTAYLYADGVLKGTSACAAIIPSGGMYLGRYAGSASGFLTGSIDQLRIFNKALTPMEVASLYNETTPLEEPRHSLVDPFKDGSGKALYRLDGNALDESGNYNGTVIGTSVFGNGLYGRCFVGDGTSKGINSTSSLMTNYFSTAYTVSIFVKPITTSILTLANIISNPASARSGSFLNKNDYVSGAGLQGFVYSVAEGKLIIAHGTSSYDGEALATDNVVFSTGNYTHIIISKTASNVYSIYANGVVQGTSIINAANGSYVNADNRLVTIGYTYTATYSYAASYSNCEIDQVRIFNRALTASEVQTLYTEI